MFSSQRCFKPLDAVICTLVYLPRLPKRSLLPLKIFFALASWSLLLSTLIGVYMGCRGSWSPKLVPEVLLTGTLVPAFLLLMLRRTWLHRAIVIASLPSVLPARCPRDYVVCGAACTALSIIRWLNEAARSKSIGRLRSRVAGHCP